MARILRFLVKHGFSLDGYHHIIKHGNGGNMPDLIESDVFKLVLCIPNESNPPTTHLLIIFHSWDPMHTIPVYTMKSFK